MVACGVSSDDGNSVANDTDSTVRLKRVRVGTRLLLLNTYGGRHLLLLLPHVQGARPL
jgi:hypothetical protein